uniref:Bm217 n=1 Tax=Brugia malayi TaxID=6279 RepID=A0A1I9G084_BRUMA|nr:Bm217 [Brugia malayi]
MNKSDGIIKCMKLIALELLDSSNFTTTIIRKWSS